MIEKDGSKCFFFGDPAHYANPVYYANPVWSEIVRYIIHKQDKKKQAFLPIARIY